MENKEWGSVPRKTGLPTQGHAAPVLASVPVALVPLYISAVCTLVQHHRVPNTANKIHSIVSAVLRTALSSKQKFAACNAFTILCALSQHHRKHSPCSPSRQSTKSTPWCQWPCMLLYPASESSPLVRLFQYSCALTQHQEEHSSCSPSKQSIKSTSQC